MEREAERQLAGAGDAQLGEWREWTGRAFHVRRRLSLAEARRARLTVADIRRTPEAVTRAAALGDLLRLVPTQVLADEVGP